jgi:hypothetical protein
MNVGEGRMSENGGLMIVSRVDELLKLSMRAGLGGETSQRPQI